ncbi:APC family permease [Ornithinimicrobium cavernae]|uniref:APC family permease n=1 Tax=Ornithinimicrobium cavernae TaxID=2666047 RepID=UPI000D689404|nr:APC family permease [Ornithinimicrobium cavernae]
MSELRKTISTPALIAIGAAGVIGSSWLYLGSAFFADFGAGGTILGFVIATALAAFVALAYSALANRLPRAGGEVVYAVVAGNSFLGFIVGWLLIGAYASMVAFYVTATGRLLSAVWPELNSVPLYAVGGETIYLPIIAIGFALTLVVLAMNWYGAEFSSRAQLALFTIMVVFGVAVAAAGFVRGSFDNFWPMFDSGSGTSPVVSTLSFVLPAFSFLTGFGVVAILAEEARASAKRIGQIVVLSVVLAGAFYTIVLLATAWVLPWEQVAGMTNGTIEAFEVAGMPLLSTGAFVIGALGIITTFIAVFSASSRLMFALARIELLPPVLHRLDARTGTPRNALLFTTAIGLVLGLLGPGALVWFLNTIGVFIAVVWAVTVWVYYRLRSQGGLGPEPSRSWTVLLPAVGGLASVVMVFAALIPTSPLALRWPFEYLIFIGWIALGIGLYYLSPRRMPRTEVLRSLLGDYYDRQFGSAEGAEAEAEDHTVR